MTPRTRVTFCTSCLYPSLAVNLSLDRKGVCSACHLQGQMNGLSDSFWDARKDRWAKLVEESRSRSQSPYDCVVPVSGGKDSYYQVTKVLEYGMKPLLVTYHGNNYLPEGQRNLDRMRDRLGVDHIVFGPSVDILKRLNRGCFEIMGDMNWHCHAGIKIFPMRLAVKLGIPLVVWGEITWSISGMFDLDDYVQYNKRTVFEHDMRGYRPEDIASQVEGVEPRDLAWLQMPSDQEFEDSGTIGVYIGNFFNWDPNEHAARMIENYGFETAEIPFERTYRTMSNLDDMHENGIHDYLKFIKFGYGRATDHASKDIRTGYMTRDEGIDKVLQYDHVKPRRDLDRWLEYVDMTESEFDRIADTFRDPRVWWIDQGLWWKKDITGECGSYGAVQLPKEEWEPYI